MTEQKKLTDLPYATGIFDSDTFTIVQGGTSTKQVTAQLVSQYVEDSLVLTFTDTLVAGETSLSFSNEKINSNSIIEDYYDQYGVRAKNIVVTTGNVTLTFDARSTDLGVKVRVL